DATIWTSCWNSPTRADTWAGACRHSWPARRTAPARGYFYLMGSVSVAIAAHPGHQLVDVGDADGRQDEHHVDDGLPHDAGLGQPGAGCADVAGLDESAQQMDGRNADDGHGELHLQHAGIDVAEPFGLVGVPLQAQARYKGLIAPDDHHDEQVRDHDDIDQAQDDEHDVQFTEAVGMGDEMPELFQEQEYVDALRDDETQVQGQLEPAGTEDQPGQDAQAWRRR